MRISPVRLSINLNVNVKDYSEREGFAFRSAPRAACRPGSPHSNSSLFKLRAAPPFEPPLREGTLARPAHHKLLISLREMRRGKDSNLRDPCEPNGFQDRRFRPLSH